MSKQYDICGTTVHIYPVHHGNNSLLALSKYRFLEAVEYKSYLLTHGIELRIAITVKVAPQIFTQRHWDDKLRTHIRKLLAKFPCLSNAQRLEIKIFWEPKGGCWDSAKHNHKVPNIVNGMLASLLANFPSPKAKDGRGLDVALHLEHWAGRLKYHLPAFVYGRVLERDEKRKVVLARKEEKVERKGGLVAVKHVPKEKRVMVVDKARGLLSWGDKTEGDVVMASLAF